MSDQDDNFWGEPIYAYTRAPANANGVLVDLTTATDDKGQSLCQQAGFTVPVAIPRTAWAKAVEAGGTRKPHGDGEILELKGGQSRTGRILHLLWMLRVACGQSSNPDRVYFQILVDVNDEGRHETVKLWALCGPGDDASPVITMMLLTEDSRL